MTAYEYLKDWQQLIGSFMGSLMGFAALFFGANHKFKLDRKQDDQLREQEAKSVLAALYGEIIGLREQAGRLAKFLGDTLINGRAEYISTDDLRRYCSLSEPFLYKELASKIGLIDPKLIIEIAEFYRIYDEAKRELIKLDSVKLIDCKVDRFIMHRCCNAVMLLKRLSQL